MNTIIKFSDYILEKEMSRKEKRLERREERLQKKLDKIEKKRGEDSLVLGDQEENQKRLSTPFYQIKGKELPMDQKIDINGQSVEPYGIANNIMNTWIEDVKSEILENIDSKFKVAIKALIERSLQKIFPIVSKYLIPSVKFEGKSIIEENNIEPKDFWSQVWPQIWKEMNQVEKGIVKQKTSLTEKTNYEELTQMIGKALSSDEFSGYNETVSDQLSTLMELFGSTFSAIFKDKPVDVSQELMGKIVKDLNAQGAKINFKSSEKKQDGEKELKNVELGSSSQKVWAETIIKQIEAFRALLKMDDKDDGSKEEGEKKSKKENEEEGDVVKNMKFPSNVKTEADLEKWALGLSSEQKNLILSTLGVKFKEENRSPSKSNEENKENKILRRGMKSEEVGVLQDKLGMEVGKDRTNFGPKTEATVKEFQRKNGLKEDGIVGPETKKKLGM